MHRLMLFALLISTARAAEPLTMVDGFAFLQVTVNGRPFRMLLDTGASSCVLAPDAAERAGLRYNHRVVVETEAGTRTVGASTAQVRVGNIEAFDAEIVVQPIDGIRKVDRKADGVLGQSVLGRFPFLVDYRKRRLLIGREAEESGAALGTLLAAEQVEGRLVVPVTLVKGGRPWRLAFDSGSRYLLLECGGGCPRFVEHTGIRTIYTNLGDCKVEQGYLRRVQVGDVTVARPETLLIHRMPRPGREEGLLPAHMFSAVYVDAARNQIRLAR
jgi:clan AA aspartic protease (TIGR02281 family)